MSPFYLLENNILNCWELPLICRIKGKHSMTMVFEKPSKKSLKKEWHPRIASGTFGDTNLLRKVCKRGGLLAALVLAVMVSFPQWSASAS